jgi:hypothetical protein
MKTFTNLYLSTTINMYPFRFPSAAATVRKRLITTDGYRWRICPVRNTHHDGLIETDHEVLLLIRKRIMKSSFKSATIYLPASFPPIRHYTRP